MSEIENFSFRSEIWPDTFEFNPNKPPAELASKNNKKIDEEFATLSNYQKLEYKKLKDEAEDKVRQLHSWSEEGLRKDWIRENRQRIKSYFKAQGAFLGLAAVALLALYLDLIQAKYTLALLVLLTGLISSSAYMGSYLTDGTETRRWLYDSIVREKVTIEQWFKSRGLNESAFRDSVFFGERLVLDAFKLEGIVGTDTQELWDKPDSLKYIRAWLDLRMHDELMEYVTWQPRKSD